MNIEQVREKLLYTSPFYTDFEGTYILYFPGNNGKEYTTSPPTLLQGEFLDIVDYALLFPEFIQISDYGTHVGRIERVHITKISEEDVKKFRIQLDRKKELERELESLNTALKQGRA